MWLNTLSKGLGEGMNGPSLSLVISCRGCTHYSVAKRFAKVSVNVLGGWYSLKHTCAHPEFPVPLQGDSTPDNCPLLHEAREAFVAELVAKAGK